jgi:hypothetical protein
MMRTGQTLNVVASGKGKSIFWSEMMNYAVVICHAGEQVRLACDTMEQAQIVRRSFVNWGGMGFDIRIEVK